MKLFLIVIIVLCRCLSVYAEVSHVLNGIWVRGNTEKITDNPQSSIDYDGSGIRGDSVIEILIMPNGTGSYWNVSPFEIDKVEQQGDNEFILYISKSDSQFRGKEFITLIDEDSIFITHGPGIYLYDGNCFRFTSSTNILSQKGVMTDSPPQYGLLNDTRVRLRTKPNLESATWGFLNTGDEVLVIDKGDEMQKIDDMEDYWYKVRYGSFPDGFPDGWVYGAFLDIKPEAVYGSALP